VGANIGFYSWLAGQHVPIQQIVMFEPDPSNFKLIELTIVENSIQDCRAMNIALCDRDGDATFLVDDASGATGSLEVVGTIVNEQSLHHAYRVIRPISCRTRTVDSLIGEGVGPPDIMKVDVEGAEHLVFAGAERCLRQKHPVLIVETSNGPLVSKLRDMGYGVGEIDASNLLFVHRESGIDPMELTRNTRCQPRASLA
jgi:FkbM family methyltransferase